MLGDVRGDDRLREGGPSGAGVEFVHRGEERFAGDDVDVEPGFVVIPELVPERRLGRAALGDLVLQGGEPRGEGGVLGVLLGHGGKDVWDGWNFCRVGCV